MALILVGGGSRSGKSTYALTLARGNPGPYAFIATAQAFDDEMRERIAKHQAERAQEFITYEEPFDLAGRLAQLREPVIIIDCLTLWLTNLLLQEEAAMEGRINDFLTAATASAATVIAVTNEVGCGIVPENALARRFRDLQGRLNQDAARAAREVYWMVFGCALKVKQP
ncbi:MAG: bifunctional adenosylcobinamide kinase/adenosylcobinamide-phosphate guanylyltransferase [Bryobacteraceae bacterium]|nr:bifunctional adenosylcobinamide kinase/adenosylcobinamide-phosphate guanylyltransferase [Bryobacteraceae bacterium]